MRTAVADTPEIRLARGSVRLNAACYARYFGGTQGIILLYEAEQRRLWVLPVRSARAGGFLLKQVNLQGDRAAATHGFFRDHDISEDLEATFTPRWDSTRQGLMLDLSSAENREPRTENKTYS
jgi:hypothetical protein